MSHSTVESKQENYCELILTFPNRKQNAVALSINASYNGADIEKKQLGDAFSCILSFSNVRMVSNLEDIDGYLPIEVYLGSESRLPPILLLEETDYTLKLEGETDSAFSYFDSLGDIRFKKIKYPGVNNGSIYTLNFKGYVGKGFFDVSVDNEQVSIPFEVRSKKIRYISDYPLMLQDVAEFSTSLLLQQTSPLYKEVDVSNSFNDTLYEDFLVINYLFTRLRFLEVYEYVKNNKHRRMIPDKEYVPAGLSGYLDPADIIDLIRPDNLVQMVDGPIKGMYSPKESIETTYEEDYDTPENRVVKDLILTVQRRLHSLSSQIMSKTSTYIVDRLGDMCYQIDLIASDSWLKGVRDLTRIPYESTILQYRSGYSELFYIYQLVGLGTIFKSMDLENLLEGHSTPVYRIYEYWCYTRLYRCLFNLSNNQPPFPWEKECGKWSMSIKGNKKVTFVVNKNNTVMNVDLFYNKTFKKNDIAFRSYSLPLRPDFTLMITNEKYQNRKFIINFDAKYKTKPIKISQLSDNSEIDSDCWEYDLYKMHTYRDALIHNWGSYVLFPGHKENFYFKKETNKNNTIGLPSIGAIPLIPGDNKDAKLTKALDQILTEIAQISSGELDIEKDILLDLI